MFIKLIIAALVLVIVGGGVYLLVIRPRQQTAQTNLGQDSAKYDALISKIKKIVLVPDENPTVATIANLEEVQKQNAAFYADAQVGDTVIIFTTKALIYRESEDKIINLSPITK